MRLQAPEQQTRTPTPSKLHQITTRRISQHDHSQGSRRAKDLRRSVPTPHQLAARSTKLTDSQVPDCASASCTRDGTPRSLTRCSPAPRSRCVPRASRTRTSRSRACRGAMSCRMLLSSAWAIPLPLPPLAIEVFDVELMLMILTDSTPPPKSNPPPPAS